MKLQVIGTGSSGNAYCLSHDGKQILLDAGLPFGEIKRALGFDLSALQAALITHEHQDHCKAIHDLAAAAVPVIMSDGTKAAIFGDETPFSVRMVEPVSTFDQVDDWLIMPFSTEHDAAEPVGYVLANGDYRILYLTDSYYCKYRFAGLTHIIIECNFIDDVIKQKAADGEIAKQLMVRLRRSHFSLHRTKQFLANNNLSRAQKIVLVHLSDSNSDEQRMVDEITQQTGIETIAARQGMVIDFDLCPF